MSLDDIHSAPQGPDSPHTKVSSYMLTPTWCFYTKLIRHFLNTTCFLIIFFTLIIPFATLEQIQPKI